MAVFVVGDPIPIGTIPAAERGRLAEAGFIQSGRFAATGFGRFDGQLVVALPKAYAGGVPAAETVRATAAMLLVRVLRKALAEKVGGTVVPADEPLFVTFGLDAPGALQSIEAAALLRQDFLREGLYWNRRPERTTGRLSAPVDWTRTVRQRAPALTLDGPVFFEMVHRVRLRDANDDLHRLHATVLRRVLSETGEAHRLPPFRPLEPAEITALDRNPQRVLSTILARTYRDRGRRLVRLIGVWLRVNRLNVETTAARPYLLSAPGFHVVWQQMLAHVLHEPGQDAGFDGGRWLAVGGTDAPGIRPEADAVRRIEHPAGPIRFVFDAKDKRVRAPKRSGSEADHYKQAVYGLLAAAGRERVVNVLLFPEVGRPEPARLLGVHDWVWPRLRRLPETRVYEVAVDYERLAREWVGSRSASDGDPLQKVITLLVDS